MNKGKQLLRFYKIITCVVCLSLVIQFYPQKANAVAVAAPAGIEIAAGAYVGVALALGGTLGFLGYTEYSEEVNAHAMRVWDGAQDVVKESLKTSIDIANVTGTYTVSLSDTVVDFWRDAFWGTVDAANVGVNYEFVPSETIITGGNQVSDPYRKITGSASAGGYSNVVAIASNYYGQGAFYIQEIQVDWADFSKKMKYILLGHLADGSSISFNSVIPDVSNQRKFYMGEQIIDFLNTANSASYMSVLGGTTLSSMAQDVHGGTVLSVLTQYSSQAMSTTIDNALDWLLKRDTLGKPKIMIPTPEFVPRVAQGNPNAGQPLTWDGTQYKLGPDVYEGPIDWSYPKPTIGDVTDAATGATTTTISVPIDGVQTAVNDYTLTRTNPNPPGNEPGGETPRIPWAPMVLIMAFFDLFRALLMYMIRALLFLLSLPTIASVPLSNPGLNMFLNYPITGGSSKYFTGVISATVTPIGIVRSMLTLGTAFAIYKAIAGAVNNGIDSLLLHKKIDKD